MPDTFIDFFKSSFKLKSKEKKKDNYLLHIGLFILTFITTTIAGVEWTTGRFGPYEIETLLKGLPYSISIMVIISFHEFGHYFAARFHKVSATLPYYIPFPPISYLINFGTMGAVIRTRQRIYSRKAMFDIGIAGPLSGFAVCLGILIYGFMNVPGVDYILSIHPEYLEPEYGKTGLALVFGDSILFSTLRTIFTDHLKFFPPMTEIYHYPFLCAGWFGLLITSMNMIPVGQLDGGHITYTMFGEENSYKFSVIAFLILFVLGLAGIVNGTLELGLDIGWGGWLFWALILYFIIKLKHPPVPDPVPLSKGRMLLGYLSLFIFVISFSPAPIMLTLP
jgi:membrane-associated protease RseP (regulator of RpoE activity)